MILVLILCLIGDGDSIWSGFSGYSPDPIVKPVPAPVDPPKPDPPPERKLIYRKDSKGFQCQSYTEHDLDLFIQGRESVYLQQAEQQAKLQAQQQYAPQQSFTMIPQVQYGVNCENGVCKIVTMPY